MYDTTVTNLQYNSDIGGLLVMATLNSIGVNVNDTNAYIKYYNRLDKEHRFTAIGVDAGYSFSFGSIDKLIDKIKIGNSRLGNKLSKEIAKGFVEYLKKDASVETIGYIKIASFKSPISRLLNPTDFWIKHTKRPKGK